MQRIIHFCFIHGPDCEAVSLDGMQKVHVDEYAATDWGMWVQQHAGADKPGRINEYGFVIGKCHGNGDGFYAKALLNGAFLSCRTDAISGVPVFFLDRNGVIVVSSSLMTLIQACRCLGIRLVLDMGACSEAMLASYVFTRGRTLIEGVQRLEPNHEMRVDIKSGKTTIQRMAQDFSYAEKREPWRWCVDNLKNRIINGLKRYEGKNVAVMLSGGADSRIVAACAIEAGLKPEFITFGQSTVNASDFAIASVVAHRLGRRIRVHSASAENFRHMWKNVAQKSNWTDMWNLAKLPPGFFAQISEYDVVLRGDGDGIYGWKGIAGSVADILHLLEISPMAAALRGASFFEEPRAVFAGGEESRIQITKQYEGYSGSLIELENVLYQRHREYGCIAQNIWSLDNWMVADAPLLWKESIDVAQRIPSRYVSNKQVIFAVLNTFEQLRDVPFSRGPSWNDPLENWCSGLAEELVEYVAQWSPWPINRERLAKFYEAPPPVPSDQCSRSNPVMRMKKKLQQRPWVRKHLLDKYPEMVHSTFCDRGLTRLAVICNLRETLSV